MPCVVVIDIQEKLLPVMAEHEALLNNCVKFLKIAQELGFQVYLTEQNPAKLGATIESIKTYSTQKIFVKNSFSAYPVIPLSKETPLLILGIEAHICVYQSVKDFLKHGFEVTLLADCTSSRDFQNKALALEDLKSLGARILSTEIVAFEHMQTYTHPSFKAVSKIIK
ncbi:isochorismatase family protein [Helicobacter baculiformis]|uniref:Isochorismatase family protein n=1 Tax=Helicobacter baculiformis TaxID=427351 RepID=A0ABV7ZI93_9HELI|nr:isochorismatase family protein [Helicobacter baculiformis]